jgi:TonB family protein
MSKLATTAPHCLLRRRPLGLAGCALVLFALSFLPAASAQEGSRKVIAKTAPTYPELAKRMHVTGKVRLEVVILPSGAVKTANMVGGSPVFEKNAVECVKQWRFEPAQTETKGLIILEFEDH